MELNLSEFEMFDPKKDKPTSLPDAPGNYILVLKKDSKLPDTEPEIKTFEYDDGGIYGVVYTGISKKSIRGRYRQHFTGNNAGRSTLRKTLGSMMRMKKVPRDVKIPKTERQNLLLTMKKS